MPVFFTDFFLNRVRTAYNVLLLRTQCGFRTGVGTDDAIWGLSQCMRKSKSKFYILFVDLTAAYDKIPRKLLFLCLLRRLKCNLLLDILRSIYTGTKATIKGSKHPFDIGAGVRQGALESPVIFNIYFDLVLRIIKKRLVAELGDDFGLTFDYNIPNEVTTRAMRAKCRKSRDSFSLTELLYADDADGSERGPRRDSLPHID